jgi:hypothetical protein
VSIRSLIARALAPVAPLPAIAAEPEGEGILTKYQRLARERARTHPDPVRGRFAAFASRPNTYQAQQLQRRQAALEAQLRQGVGPTR